VAAVSDPVVILGAAGIVNVKVAVLVVSATDVAVMVTVCDELVAAGAVKVTPVALWLESVPPVVLQLTPSLFLSFVTEAVMVSVSAASTVVTDAVMETPTVGLPPQPEMVKDAMKAMVRRQRIALILRPDRTEPFRYMITPGCDVFCRDQL